MLNISIVLYKNDMDQVTALCQVLLQTKLLHRIYLVDNSPQPSVYPLDSEQIRYIWNEGKNLGYGTAHNIAIRNSVYDRIDYHLAMNADITVTPLVLEQLQVFMNNNPQVGIVQPKILYPDGRIQYVAKCLPTPLDVFARRFLPSSWFRARNERYTLQRNRKGKRVNQDYHLTINVPYLSGCFLFMRTQAVLQAGLFDERFFMYPEDIDLTRRVHRDYLTVFLPDIQIYHHHEQGSYKSLRLLWIHIVNMCRYFHKWGWFFDRERRMVNRLTVEQLNS